MKMVAPGLEDPGIGRKFLIGIYLHLVLHAGEPPAREPEPGFPVGAGFQGGERLDQGTQRGLPRPGKMRVDGKACGKERILFVIAQGEVVGRDTAAFAPWRDGIERICQQALP